MLHRHPPHGSRQRLRRRNPPLQPIQTARRINRRERIARTSTRQAMRDCTRRGSTGRGDIRAIVRRRAISSSSLSAVVPIISMMKERSPSRLGIQICSWTRTRSIQLSLKPRLPTRCIPTPLHPRSVLAPALHASINARLTSRHLDNLRRDDHPPEEVSIPWVDALVWKVHAEERC